MAGSRGDKAGPHPGQDALPITPQTHPHTHSHCDHADTPIHLTYVALGRGRKPSPRRKPTDMGKPCILFTHSGPGQELIFFLIDIIIILTQTTLFEGLLYLKCWGQTKLINHHQGRMDFWTILSSCKQKEKEKESLQLS